MNKRPRLPIGRPIGHVTKVKRGKHGLTVSVTFEVIPGWLMKILGPAAKGETKRTLTIPRHELS
jgi:hypothetical protein